MAPRKCSKKNSSPDQQNDAQYDNEDVDTFYDMLVDNMEKAQSKNARLRLDGLQKLTTLLASKPAPNFISANQETLVYIAGRPCNKSEKEAEQHVLLLGLIALQAGAQVAHLMQEPMEQLRSILMDSAKPGSLRTACANSLAVISRFCVEESEDVEENLKALQYAWGGIRPGTREDPSLATSSLAAYCIVILDGNSRSIRKMQQEVQPEIFNLLSSAHLEVRLAAAEALGHLYEFMLEARPGFRFDNHEDVIEKLLELKGDFSKKTSKSDRRLQRRAIREIVDFMDGESDAPEELVKIGHQTLRLDTFGSRAFYSILCDILGGGISRHLMFNEVLREEFELGDVCGKGMKMSARDKRIEIFHHHCNDKYRDQGRAKDRNIRMGECYGFQDEGCEV